MQAIKRGSGFTPSERYLAELADHTFLDLWSYPNTFIDKRVRQRGDGKELCDLLVVCGQNIFIFSDKSCSWPDSKDINLSWARWYRRAIDKSVGQIRGAERWLKEFPGRIFIDPACTQALPIELPKADQCRVHGIVIALGSEAACREFCDDDDGSLMILSELTGKNHIDPNAIGYMPFAIGDVDLNGPFVHVFDKSALDLIMREMDTVSDFADYLCEREAFIRGKRLLHAPAEAELIYLYMQHVDAAGKHRFPPNSKFGVTEDYKITLPAGSYNDFISSDAYRAKREADKISYMWDRLIKIFTENIIAGTSVSVFDEAPSAARAEPALRIMALDNAARSCNRICGRT